MNHGADAVIGFSNSVSNIYYQKMLYEIMINGMVLSGDTLGNSIDRAKDLHGKNDPNVKYAESEIRLKGNENYCLTDRIEIDFDFPEDTQNTITTTVPVATATTITTTKAASEMPPDIFGEKVYSMPGPICISFSPIDAGTNHDPRTLDIITKLYNELDDSDKAKYHSYLGDMHLVFERKHTRDNRIVGDYDSVNEIIECAESIDNTLELYGKQEVFYNFSDNLVPNSTTSYFKDVKYRAEHDNEQFNLCAALAYSSDLEKDFIGDNHTIITIIKDNYYYLSHQPFKNITDYITTEERNNNYFINHLQKNGSNGNVSTVYYIIDMRSDSVKDEYLDNICKESGGKYIQYSEENLDNLIKLINARRAYIDE